MRKPKKALHPTAWILISALICSISLTGCKTTEDNHPVHLEQTTKDSISKITVGDINCDVLSTELTLSNADPAQLEKLLPLLPNLEKLILEGTIPPVQTLTALQKQFAHVSLICPIEFDGSVFYTDALCLDLTGKSVDTKQLFEYLPLFSQLQELILLDTPLTDEEKITICSSFPDVFVHCTLPLAGQYYPTDTTEMDLSGCVISVEEMDQVLPCFSNLQKVDMSFCEIPDEEMDALNQRYPDISIVWTLQVGLVTVRTDAIYFYPAGSNYYPTSAEMAKLRYCTELIAVDIGHTRATDCEFLWHTPKVKYLILADTGITDITPVGNLKDLIYLELFNLKIDDYSPLLNCTKLQDLNIGTTHADPEPLSKMTWLHNLQWHRADQNPETKEAVLKLPEQLPDTNVELYPKKKARNIGGPWRYLPNYYVFRDLIGATYFNQDQIGDYWGEEDGKRIMACESGKSFAAYTLAEIVRERIDKKEPIIGIKNIDSEKAEILYQTLLHANPDI